MFPKFLQIVLAWFDTFSHIPYLIWFVPWKLIYLPTKPLKLYMAYHKSDLKSEFTINKDFKEIQWFYTWIKLTYCVNFYQALPCDFQFSRGTVHKYYPNRIKKAATTLNSKTSKVSARWNRIEIKQNKKFRSTPTQISEMRMQKNIKDIFPVVTDSHIFVTIGLCCQSFCSWF